MTIDIFDTTESQDEGTITVIFRVLGIVAGILILSLIASWYPWQDSISAYDGGQEEYYLSIQQLVDRMSPSFDKLGYYVDLVHDKKALYASCLPPLLYIRFKVEKSKDSLSEESLLLVPSSDIESSLSASLLSKTTATNDNSVQELKKEISSKLSLAERMQTIQQQVREEYELYLTNLQQQKRRQQRSTTKQFGLDMIFLHKLSEYRSCILISMIPLGFMFAVLTFSFLSGPLF
jgi:hypothetical protein